MESLISNIFFLIYRQNYQQFFFFFFKQLARNSPLIGDI